MKRDLQVQLGRLAELNDNWDTYGGKAITPEAIHRCESIEFVPMSDGGIQIELTDGVMQLDLVIDPHGRLCGMSMDRDTPGSSASFRIAQENDWASPIAYRPPAAARVLGISRSQLFRLMASGEIRARKAGKATLIPAEELHRYIESLP